MDDDTIMAIVIVLGGGLAVWWLLNRKTSTSVIAPPCNVGATYSGVGASIPCSAVKELIGGVSHVIDNLPLIGSNKRPATVAEQVKFANSQGRIAPNNSWGVNGSIMNAAKLPTDYENYVMPSGQPGIRPIVGSPTDLKYKAQGMRAPIAPGIAPTVATWKK